MATFEQHLLASPAGELQLSNGVAVRLHWNIYPQAWRDQFSKYCLPQEQGEQREPLYVAGPGAQGVDSPCWVSGACDQHHSAAEPR